MQGRCSNISYCLRCLFPLWSNSSHYGAGLDLEHFLLLKMFVPIIEQFFPLWCKTGAQTFLIPSDVCSYYGAILSIMVQGWSSNISYCLRCLFPLCYNSSHYGARLELKHFLLLKMFVPIMVPFLPLWCRARAQQFLIA